MKNIYVCGPTVYSKAHIGNLRPIITFDIFRRSLEFLGEEVNLIHNITDIDDKIIDAAIKEKTTEEKISDKYKKHYLSLLETTNVLKPTSMPEVVSNINKIISFIEELIKNGNAYEVNGNVYFDTQSINNYGKLANRDISFNKEKENGDKKHQADFVVWKDTKKGKKFEAPWISGRPGWHTECAVFINENLNGESLDIHGGGIDLLFPHHENENAQYQAINKKEIAKDWKHIGKLNIDGEKMSKSIGNVIDAEKFINKYGEDVLRMIFLTTSYSAPINIADEMIQSNIKIIKSFKSDFIRAQTITNKENLSTSKKVAELINKWKLAEAMKLINNEIKIFRNNENEKNAGSVISIMKLIGFSFANKSLSDKEKQMFEDWKKLRLNKDYNEADKIRKSLVKMGLI